MPTAEKGIVVQIRKINDDIWDMTVSAPVIAGNSRAGQFVHVRVSEEFNPFLRRPLSVGPCSGDFLRLIFIVKGRGTRWLCNRCPGDHIDMIGPLGHPFQLPEPGAHSFLVAGGIGIVPLLLLKDQLPEGTSVDFLLGVRSVSLLTIDNAEIRQKKIQLASDDGSIGFHGSVVELLEQYLHKCEGKGIAVYGCGPYPMLSVLKSVCTPKSIRLYVSLEVPMGCGMGACQSCAVSKVDSDGYYLVCQDGPVFDAAKVDLKPEAVV